MNKQLGTWLAPAKLNLFLHIVGRRADGYHLLQTAFQFVNLCDTLSFDITRDGRIERTRDIPKVAPETDLTLRAALLLQQATGTSLGARITCEKKIPLGGGLGGGSSDAATTLIALNQLWNTGLPVDQLAQLGVRLGADVPVFVHGHAAWAEGVGEILTPINPPEPWYVVIHPPCHVSTAEIFNLPELTRNTSPIKIRDFFAGSGRNDCESTVRTRYPAVAAALDWLGKFSTARMTGTGACVFAAFPTEARAREIAMLTPPEWRVFVAEGLNRSPLRAQL
ncbi:MAG: 4-(cytidine 5'-diphospho)-2-C-methyl-D-erythritol kinase [Gammaproteobacteria bacterium]|nr:4-(cytidine 5'-diphospho)-2-C-methyl-D-erythritol kinase [Gammaproteobacteria bacterium]